jgi:hypothetical protein
VSFLIFLSSLLHSFALQITLQQFGLLITVSIAVQRNSYPVLLSIKFYFLFLVINLTVVCTPVKTVLRLVFQFTDP